MVLIYTIIFTLVKIKDVVTVGEKAFKACQEFGRNMIECRNILNPSQKMRVPIDLLLFPHMVLIGYQGENNNTNWKCGGSLISPNYVLTAAHCLFDPDSGRPKHLRVGTATFEFDEEDEIAQERTIKKVIAHPNYKPPSKYDDIALIIPNSPFELNRDIRIGCLHQGEEINPPLIAIGFGTTQSGSRKSSHTLMNVEVNIVDNTVCNKSMKSLIKRSIISEGIKIDQLCAGDYEHGGRDTCQGDSGGPLQYMPTHVDCVKSFPLHRIVGITSFGKDCGRRMAPGVYTRISKYVAWIESIVWKD